VRPPEPGEPRARRANHLRQLLQTEQLQSQWEALGAGEDSCEVVMGDEGEEGEAVVEEKKARRGRGRGPRECVSHDFTSLPSVPSGSVSAEAEAHRDEDALSQGAWAGEGESWLQRKIKGGVDRKWTSHVDRPGSDALLSPDGAAWGRGFRGRGRVCKLAADGGVGRGDAAEKGEGQARCQSRVRCRHIGPSS